MKYILFCFGLLAGQLLYAQNIQGKLYAATEEGREILPGATVQWLGTNIYTVVNENGVFELSTQGITDKRMVASFAGYTTDTIHTNGKVYLSIVLHKNATALAAVVIKGNKSYIGNAVGKVEVISRKELSKAACCDLAGCFGTQASVQAHTTNIVTNAQELRILGLSGVYNQILVDGLPMLQGASYTYGVSSYPGTVVENIYVSKGNTSVLQGFESISGQINLETRQPGKTDKLHVNAYVNSFGENHYNVNIGAAVGKSKHWNTLLSLHTVQPARRTDRNKDGFLDLPLLTRYMAYNKWKYRSDKEQGLSVQASVRFVHEERVGGQNGFSADKHKGSATIYGQLVQYHQPEGYVKLNYRFSDKNVLAVSATGSVHHQQSWFGTTSYDARQTLSTINLQHELLLNTKYQLKYGVSYRYQLMDEAIAILSATPVKTYAGQYATRLNVPGLYAENSFSFADDKLMLIAGARLDHHQQYGWYFTPRAMVKYAIDNRHTFRASIGSGWRQVNLFAEQVTMLASSRDIVFKESLQPEKALNWGLSHTYKFTTGNVSGTLSADFYSTIFNNQFFPDYDADVSHIYIQNFTGRSMSNALQIEGAFTFYNSIDIRAAYNYLYVYQQKGGNKILLPFNPTNRVMMAMSYRSSNNQWQADVNGNWYDRMRLPDTYLNPEPYRRSSHSNAYATVNAQLTFRVKKLEWYAGCENIFNYTQPNPIISAQHPFGPYFDLSSVWGPTRGREFYAGFRFSIQ